MPDYFKSINKPRQNGRRGGGIAALYRENIKCEEITEHESYESFEHLLVRITQIEYHLPMKMEYLNICFKLNSEISLRNYQSQRKN